MKPKHLFIFAFILISFQSSAQALRDSLFMYPGDTWALNFPAEKHLTDAMLEDDSTILPAIQHVYKVDSCYMYEDGLKKKEIYGCLLHLQYPKNKYADSLFVYDIDVIYLHGRNITSRNSDLSLYE